MSKRDEIRSGGYLILWMLLSVPLAYMAAGFVFSSRLFGQWSLLVAILIFFGGTAVALVVAFVSAVGLLVCASRAEEPCRSDAGREIASPILADRTRVDSAPRPESAIDAQNATQHSSDPT